MAISAVATATPAHPVAGLAVAAVLVAAQAAPVVATDPAAVVALAARADRAAHARQASIDRSGAGFLFTYIWSAAHIKQSLSAI